MPSNWFRRRHPFLLVVALAAMTAFATTVLLSQNEVPAILYEAF